MRSTRYERPFGERIVVSATTEAGAGKPVRRFRACFLPAGFELLALRDTDAPQGSNSMLEIG